MATKKKPAELPNPVTPPLHQPVLPGQDPARVAEFYDSLVKEFEPAGIVVAWWLNDIAHLSARIEHLRLAIRGFYALQMRNIYHDEILFNNIFAPEELQIVYDMLSGGTDTLEKIQSSYKGIYNRLLGAVLDRSMTKLKILDDLEQGLLRERDRVFNQFERRRRDQLIAAVTTVESGALKQLDGPK